MSNIQAFVRKQLAVTDFRILTGFLKLRTNCGMIIGFFQSFFHHPPFESTKKGKFIGFDLGFEVGKSEIKWEEQGSMLCVGDAFDEAPHPFPSFEVGFDRWKWSGRLVGVMRCAREDEVRVRVRGEGEWRDDEVCRHGGQRRRRLAANGFSRVSWSSSE